MKQRYIRLVAVAVIGLCAGQSFPAKKQSKLTELEKISLEFKNLADKIVLKGQDLPSIEDAWVKNSEKLPAAINLVKFNMPKTGSDSLSPSDANSIKNAYVQFDDLWKILFTQDAAYGPDKVDKKFIESVRAAITVKTWFGGDAPGTRKIKIALRDALLHLKRIVEKAGKQQKVPKKVAALPGEYIVEIEY